MASHLLAVDAALLAVDDALAISTLPLAFFGLMANRNDHLLLIARNLAYILCAQKGHEALAGL